MTDSNRIRKLLKAYIAGSINREDFDELHDYLLYGRDEEDLAAFMKDLLEEMKVNEKLPVDSEKIYQQIISNPQFLAVSQATTAKPVSLYHWRWLGGIAAMLCLSAGLFFSLQKQPLRNLPEKQQKPVAVKQKPVVDETAGAILRLADGTIIDLDSAANGLLATQGNTRVVLKGDELAYQNADGTDADHPAMNSIITPKGRQYQVILPDGTKVWLNAATTLTYPVRFSGNKRLVEMQGEAYFEVVQNKEMPFIVKSALQEVEVLGTSFNVSSYKDDAETKTTLVNGKVRVKRQLSFNGKQSSAILNPGQQAIIKPGRNNVHTQPVNTEEIVSWKEGLFVFDNEDVKEGMKKVSRWYNVEVEYRDGMEGKLIGGTIPRFRDIHKLMQSLQATGLLRYKMEGGKIIIMK